jgi:hypothetical protein
MLIYMKSLKLEGGYLIFLSYSKLIRHVDEGTSLIGQVQQFIRMTPNAFKIYSIHRKLVPHAKGKISDRLIDV